MTLETERPTFRGVVCLHCKGPIAVPAIVDSLEAASDAPESAQRKSQVFNVRCPSCHKEKPYRTREILDFEGAPPVTMNFERAAGPVNWYPPSGMARTAKA
jgi:hypothetical protein